MCSLDANSISIKSLTEVRSKSLVMALTMQAIGCPSSFASGVTLIGSARGLTSPRRARNNLSPRSSVSRTDQGEGEDVEGSGVDNDDTAAAQWRSADFLDLRLRSSGLICNEAIQALRNHFRRKDERSTVGTATKDEEHAPPSSTTSQLQSSLRPLSNVRVLDDAFFSQMYSSNRTPYGVTTTCSFLDESFC